MHADELPAQPAADDFEVVVIGAGVAGIYQLHRLLNLGVRATILEAAPALGGTWYANRYPGCRFDSESYTYGYSHSDELLQEWNWTELFTSQPENLRYLNHVADKFDLRRHMQFNCRVREAHYDEQATGWRLELEDGRRLTCRFLVTALGLLSAPTVPRLPGMDTFHGPSFHTYDWPHEDVDLRGKRVGVIGTGATGVQVIAAIAREVEQLVVLQRRPNWCVPLNNRPISTEEMAEIKQGYREIFERCSQTPGGFIHAPDRRGFYNVAREERVAMWDRLYDEPGFGIWLQNFREIFTDERANEEFSEYVADRIRGRVHDPITAEKLIPTDHGFGVQRVPLESGYYEAYNLDHVRLVDLRETPLVAVTPQGVRTTAEEIELDVIVYATGFDAITGAFDRIDIRGRGGLRLRDKWSAGPITYLGMLVAGFPNLIMISGPQSGGAAINYPRGIELSGDWALKLLDFARGRSGCFEVDAEAEERWTAHVADVYQALLSRKARNWSTGFNSNIEGREDGQARYLVYNGGAPKYRALLDAAADEGYPDVTFR